jgi:hypothetical protein
MPILGAQGAASARAFGLTSGAKKAKVDYLLIGGGGGGGGQGAAGGGAGGFRTSFPGGTKLELLVGKSYDVTIGIGGNGWGVNYSALPSNSGGDSYISLSGATAISSTGGGRGWPGEAPTIPPDTLPSGMGGSGSGSHRGNKGDYTPAEGNPGGPGSGFSPNVNFVPSPGHGGGGGGFANAGTTGGPTFGGTGGAGTTANITGTPFQASAGGGAGGFPTPGPGGSGGGGDGGAPNSPGNPANTFGSAGGGGGGGPASQYQGGGAGYIGRVVIRTPGDYTITATPPSNPVGTDSGDNYVIFNTTGTLNIS